MLLYGAFASGGLHVTHQIHRNYAWNGIAIILMAKQHVLLRENPWKHKLITEICELCIN